MRKFARQSNRRVSMINTMKVTIGNTQSLALAGTTATRVEHSIRLFTQVDWVFVTDSRSNWLLNAIVTEVPLNECRKRYEGIQMIDETQLCAHDIINRSDACQGDSGSSLQVKHFDDFHIVGVTSFGVGCGSDIPAVYTRVSRFVHWISQIVWPWKESEKLWNFRRIPSKH